MVSKLYAVIDTNVVVSAMFTHNPQSPTKLILDYVLQGKVIPLYSDEIINEYQDVLSREQFSFNPDNVAAVINAIERFGIKPGRTSAGNIVFPEKKDIVFYEIALSKEGSFLVKGNIKHFPKTAIVVSPTEFLNILIS